MLQWTLSVLYNILSRKEYLILKWKNRAALQQTTLDCRDTTNSSLIASVNTRLGKQFLIKTPSLVHQVHTGIRNNPPDQIPRISASCRFSSFKPTVSLIFNMDRPELSCWNSNTGSSLKSNPKQMQPWTATKQSTGNVQHFPVEPISLLEELYSWISPQFNRVGEEQAKENSFPVRSRGERDLIPGWGWGWWFLCKHSPLLISRPAPTTQVTSPVPQAERSHSHVIVQQVQSQELAVNEGCGNSSGGLKTKHSRKPSSMETEHSKMTDFFFFFSHHIIGLSNFFFLNTVKLHLPLLFSYARESGSCWLCSSSQAAGLKMKLNHPWLRLPSAQATPPQ